MKKIRIVAEMKKQIAKELGVSIQTVETSLTSMILLLRGRLGKRQRNSYYRRQVK